MIIHQQHLLFWVFSVTKRARFKLDARAPPVEGKQDRKVLGMSQEAC